MTKLANLDSTGTTILGFPEPVDGFPIEGCFPADFLHACVMVPDEAVAGWTLQSGAWASPPAAPVTPETLIEAASARQNAALTQVWSFNVGTKAAPVVLTTKLDADGQAAMLQLLSWAKLLAAAGDVQHYNMADGSPGPDITPDQAVTLAAKAGAVKSATYQALNQIAAGIAATPPTIVTIADIDAFAWPDSTSVI